MKCKKGFEVRIVKFCSNFYIGTVNELGEEQCRISQGYGSPKAARKALAAKTFSRSGHGAGVVSICNNGEGCF